MSIDNATPEEWDAVAIKNRESMYEATWEGLEACLGEVEVSASDRQVGTLNLREIPGFGGLYSISECGSVVSHGGKSKYSHKEDILLKPSVDKDGYYKVTLQKGRTRYYFRVARLVADSWVDNPMGYDIVNHIDENKKNDHFMNLEWTDAYGNWKHSEDSMPMKEIGVIKLSLGGDYICEYKSLMDAARDNGINQGNISNCLRGRCKTAGGFRWVLR